MTADDPPSNRARPGDGAGPAAAVAGSPLLEQTFDAETLYQLRAAVLAYATTAGMPEYRAVDVMLAVHELAANAVRHGAGTGRLRLYAEPGVLRCQVQDAGAAGRGGSRNGRDRGDGGDRRDGVTRARTARGCGRTARATACGWSVRSPTSSASSDRDMDAR